MKPLTVSRLISMLMLFVLAFFTMFGCGSGTDPIDTSEPIASVELAAGGCPQTVDCYSNYPGSPWYLTASYYCPNVHKITCRWAQFPGWWTTTQVNTPVACPVCINNSSHQAGTCGVFGAATAAPWTCSS